MASTILHDNEQKETDPSTDANGQHLDENKAEEILKEQDHSFTSEENAKDPDKEDEETGDDQDERDKHVIIIQPTRRIRTRFFIWGKTNAFRARHNNRGICGNQRKFADGKRI